MIFPALYNGPINYYARLVRQQEIVIEQYDHYSKQTFRNRCMILGPNGVVKLSIPVSRRHGVKTLLRDIRIDYDSNWNRIHWRGLVAAYAASPFFEYLSDELSPVYHQKFTYLLDLNRQLIELTLGILDLNIPVVLTKGFTPLLPDRDPRSIIDPKKKEAVADPWFLPMEYHQVFSDRLGFHPNLSILDLIFNEGPRDARSYLQRCLKT